MKNYKDYAMLFFDRLALKNPQILEMKSRVDTFTDTLINNLQTVNRKYGSCEAIDKIFEIEVIKYYSAIFNTSFEDFKNSMSPILDISTLDGYKEFVSESVIVYPSFEYNVAVSNSERFCLEHIPSIDIYIINENNIEKITENKNNRIDNAGKIMEESAFEIAKRWTKDKKPTTLEIETIAYEIVGLWTIEQTSASKEDVLNYLDSEASGSSNLGYLRFL